MTPVTAREPWDHPRSRGVYPVSHGEPDTLEGSSPLARGLPRPLPPGRHRVRIIPARAGFTVGCGGVDGRRGDRPRSRGVYLNGEAVPRRFMGSSPLARGLPPRFLRRRHDGRIIPARAGFTRRAVVGRRPPPDHPRSRGVYPFSPRPTPGDSGSSPLARGLLGDAVDEGDPPGIIPARAGFTRRRSTPPAASTDHPRSRGVYFSSWYWAMIVSGSSPLARGLPTSYPHLCPQGGIIPARAGFTRWRSG